MCFSTMAGQGGQHLQHGERQSPSDPPCRAKQLKRDERREQFQRLNTRQDERRRRRFSKLTSICSRRYSFCEVAEK